LCVSHSANSNQKETSITAAAIRFKRAATFERTVHITNEKEKEKKKIAKNKAWSNIKQNTLHS